MSGSDILAVQLWFGAAAIAFGAIAMTAAGWSHKFFIVAMFGVAGVLALAAIFWPRVRQYIPQRGDDIITWLATSRVAWFAMFVAGIAAVVLISKLQGYDRNQQMTDIYGREYRNQTVYVDGYNFVECTFDGVTLIFKGTAPFGLINAHYPNGTTIQFGSLDPVADMALRAQGELFRQGATLHYRLLPREDLHP